MRNLRNRKQISRCRLTFTYKCHFHQKKPHVMYLCSLPNAKARTPHALALLRVRFFPCTRKQSVPLCMRRWSHSQMYVFAFAYPSHCPVHTRDDWLAMYREKNGISTACLRSYQRINRRYRSLIATGLWVSRENSTIIRFDHRASIDSVSAIIHHDSKN